MEKLIKDREAALHLGVSISFLQKDRIFQRRIPFVRLGGAVRYRESDLNAFIQNLPASIPSPEPAATTPPHPYIGKRRWRPSNASKAAARQAAAGK